MGFVFAFPINGDDPPARSVVHQFDAVDAPRKRLFVFGMARLVGAPDMRDTVPGFDTVGDGRLIETLFVKVRFGPGYIVLHAPANGSNLAILVLARGDHPGASKEKRSQPVVVARTCRAGDRRVKSGNDAFNAIHIARLGLWRGVSFLRRSA